MNDIGRGVSCLCLCNCPEWVAEHVYVLLQDSDYRMISLRVFLRIRRPLLNHIKKGIAEKPKAGLPTPQRIWLQNVILMRPSWATYLMLSRCSVCPTKRKKRYIILPPGALSPSSDTIPSDVIRNIGDLRKAIITSLEYRK